MQNLYKVSDLKSVVLDLFHRECTPEHRYASFDYCYNYFQASSAEELEADIEKSCLELSFYLASWGMLRGSSFLLQKSSKHYEPLIRHFIQLKKDDHQIWNIDANSYTYNNIAIILEVYEVVKKLIIGHEEKNRHIVLTTKIMLGVFGCISAFDEYFTQTFRDICRNMPGRNGFRSVNKKSLTHIKKFYEANKEEIEEVRSIIHTLDFSTGNFTDRKYSRAKIIDMYGFAKSFYRVQ
jgi:hypothetical protein